MMPVVAWSQANVGTSASNTYVGDSYLGEPGGSTTTALFLERSTEAQHARVRFDQNDASNFISFGGNYWDFGLRPGGDNLRITNTTISGSFPFTTTYEDVFQATKTGTTTMTGSDEAIVNGVNDVRLQLDGTTKFYITDNGIRMGESTTNRGDVTIHHTSGSGDIRGLALENDGINSNRWNFYTTNSGGLLELYRNGSFAGSFSATGVYTASDRSLKSGIGNVGSVLKNVLLLQPQKYTYRSDESNKETIGFIAQDFAEQFPELVIEGQTDTDEQVLQINYAGVGVVAVKAIQEQQEMIDALTKQVEELKAIVDELKK